MKSFCLLSFKSFESCSSFYCLKSNNKHNSFKNKEPFNFKYARHVGISICKDNWLLRRNYYDEHCKQLEYEMQPTVSRSATTMAFHEGLPRQGEDGVKTPPDRTFIHLLLDLSNKTSGPEMLPHTYTHTHPRLCIWWIDAATAAAC